MNGKWTVTAATSMLVLGTVPGHADPTIGQYVALGGFGTLGAVYSDYREADFTGNFSQQRGAGYSRSWSTTPDSKLGAQADVDVGHGLSGVVQVVSKYGSEGNYDPGIEWANIKYAITPDLAVRVGRMLLPTLEWTDSINVGYTLPWVRIPNEIRFLNVSTHLDGIDVLYRLHTGAVTHNLEVQWQPFSTQGIFGFHNEDILVMTDNLQYGDTSVHLAYQSMNWSFNTPQFNATGRARLIDAGFTYDPGTWFVTGDSNYAHYDVLGDFLSWYLSGGVRLGRFTPYVMYSTLSSANTALSSGMSTGDGRSVTAGVRWDFAKNVDLKLQLQQVRVGALIAPDEFANLQPGFRVGDKADVISLALDFVF
jgi:hypothetical protein